jgi:hypothetical protein
MPSLIDCFRLHTLTITNNSNLTSLIDASLETCTSLIELSIRDNNDLIASNGRLSSTVYPMLKRLHVSLAMCNSSHAIDDMRSNLWLAGRRLVALLYRCAPTSVASLRHAMVRCL